MIRRLRVLDLFCGQGGASWGYRLAGHDVHGVDIRPQPLYPKEFGFTHGDALQYLADHGHEFDFIHASPVCRAHTRARGAAMYRYQHVDYIPETRRLLDEIGKPYVIENVVGAPMKDPITLCGVMFELAMYRHRLFEFGNMAAPAPPPHPPHRSPAAPMGRKPRCGQLWSIAGNFTGVYEAGIAMGMPWANQDGLRQAIPPAYTEWIGRHLMLKEPLPEHQSGANLAS